MKKIKLIFPILIFDLLFIMNAFAAQYEVTDLGPGIPYDININGTSVGIYNDNACMWDSMGNRTILTNSVLTKGIACGMNDLNQVVGINDGTSFLWENGQVTYFEGLGIACDINNSGIILTNTQYYKDGQWKSHPIQ